MHASFWGGVTRIIFDNVYGQYAAQQQQRPAFRVVECLRRDALSRGAPTHQQDGHSCGVYLCYYMYMMMRGYSIKPHNKHHQQQSDEWATEASPSASIGDHRNGTDRMMNSFRASIRNTTTEIRRRVALQRERQQDARDDRASTATPLFF